MKVVAIAAVSRNGVIGKNNDLPWNIPEDMKFFRDATRGHIVLMGRKTLDSLKNPLPKRENAVITRDVNFKKEGTTVFHSLESAITHYKGDSKFKDQILFVIGGEEIFRLSLTFLDEIWLTEIHQDIEGDVYFPNYQTGEFSFGPFKRGNIRNQTDRESEYSYSFSVFSKMV